MGSPEISNKLKLRSYGVIQIWISDPRSVWIMSIKGTSESTLAMDSPVLLMHHDPDRSWITDPDPDHPKGTQPKTRRNREKDKIIFARVVIKREGAFSIIFSPTAI